MSRIKQDLHDFQDEARWRDVRRTEVSSLAHRVNLVNHALMSKIVRMAFLILFILLHLVHPAWISRIWLGGFSQFLPPWLFLKSVLYCTQQIGWHVQGVLDRNSMTIFAWLVRSETSRNPNTSREGTAAWEVNSSRSRIYRIYRISRINTKQDLQDVQD